ncbi:MAG: hypothetical protein F6J97_15795, partial [Leptolyngbya sp. SIO4C1]|nr:hypothetical protein [Leptolyngbya sp. SIO4C1]
TIDFESNVSSVLNEDGLPVPASVPNPATAVTAEPEVPTSTAVTAEPESSTPTAATAAPEVAVPAAAAEPEVPTPAAVTADPVNVDSARIDGPGNSGNAPGRVDNPGNSGNAPGRVDNPGNSGNAPGQVAPSNLSDDDFDEIESDYAGDEAVSEALGDNGID